MQTYAEQLAFYQQHEGALLEVLAQGGAEAAAAYVSGLASDLERRVLYVFGRQGVAKRDPAQRLDEYIGFAEAGIAELLRQAQAAPD